MINKHKAMQNWVSEFLDNHYLHFEAAEIYDGVRELIPNYGDYVRKKDILGNKYKSYSFAFVGFQSVDRGTSDINTDNMSIFDAFIEWLETQQENKNFPDFGPNCSEYEIVILQNMANLAMVTEDNLAKYMLGVRIDYREDNT